MPTYNVTNPDGSKLSFKSDRPLTQSDIEEVVSSQSTIGKDPLRGAIGRPVPREEAEQIERRRIIGREARAGMNDLGIIYEGTPSEKVGVIGQGPAAQAVLAIRNLIDPFKSGAATEKILEDVIPLSPEQEKAFGQENLARQNPLTNEITNLIAGLGGGRQVLKSLPKDGGVVDKIIAGVLPAAAIGTGAGAAQEISEKGIEATPQDIIERAAKTGLVSAPFGALNAVGARKLPENIVGEIPVASGPQEIPRILESIPERDTGGIVSSVLRPIENFGERAKINIEEGLANRKAIAALPEPARKAVENGVLQRDIQLFEKATPAEKTILKRMANEAEKYGEDRLSKDPSMAVGEEFRKRIDEAEVLRKQIGKEQGDLVKDLPKVVMIDATDFSIKRLNEVPGLEGLKIAEDGKLDFSDTSLSGKGSQSDRKALQDAFDDLDGRTPFQLHRLRQELFETLGGKKGSREAITDTQERGFEALRQGAADALEQVSPEYRALNEKYAKIVQPLQQLRKYFKNIDPASEDLLEMKASLLARRLTSNAQSNPEIRNLINSLESQLKENGVKVNTRIEALQEFSNALSRYYDIAHDTSLAGQVKLAQPEIPTSIQGAVIKGGKKILGKSEAARRKFLKDFIESLKGEEAPVQ
jgi:hypothetical protein